MHHRSECLGLREGKGGGGKIKSKDCTDPCPMAVSQINIALHSHWHTKSAGSLSKTSCSEDKSKAGHQLEEKNIKCGRKTRGWVLDQSGGEGREEWRGCQHHHFFWGVESFCIPRILSSSSETKSYRETRIDRAGFRDDERGKVGLDGWKEQLTSVGLKQSTSKSCRGISRKRISVYVGGRFVTCAGRSVPTLTLAARSTSLGMSNSSSTSISSSGMASSYDSTRRKGQ